MLRPAGGGRAGGAQHPLPERDDQPGLLGERNELAGRDHAALRMPPADQRLEARDLLAAGLGLRLVVDLELLLGERLAQVVFQHAAGLQAGIHRGLEHAIGAAAVRLGAVERGVGVAQQRVGVVRRRRGTARCRC